MSIILKFQKNKIQEILTIKSFSIYKLLTLVGTKTNNPRDIIQVTKQEIKNLCGISIVSLRNNKNYLTTLMKYGEINFTQQSLFIRLNIEGRELFICSEDSQILHLSPNPHRGQGSIKPTRENNFNRLSKQQFSKLTSLLPSSFISYLIITYLAYHYNKGGSFKNNFINYLQEHLPESFSNNLVTKTLQKLVKQGLVKQEKQQYFLSSKITNIFNLPEKYRCLDSYKLNKKCMKSRVVENINSYCLSKDYNNIKRLTYPDLAIK